MKPIETSLFHRVILPKNTTAERHPTLILLHGRGADEEDLIGLGPFLDERLLLLSPRAPYPFPFSGGYMWYEFDSVGTPDPVMFRKSYESLVTFVEDITTHYPVDPARLFLLGFSMGTVMSYALALTHPRRFRGVVANSGYVPEGTHLSLAWNELAGVDFFVAHGTLDPVIPVQLGRRARQLLEQSPVRLFYKEYPMGHQISQESLEDFSSWLRQRLAP